MMARPSLIIAALFLSLSLSLTAAVGESCSTCSMIIFKENKGQWNKNILYRTDMHYANAFFEKTAITYELLDTADLVHYRSEHPFQIEYKLNEPRIIHGHAFRSVFVGADSAALRTGSDKLDEYFNYFIGKDKSKWANHVEAYRQLRYTDMYPGVDLHVYSAGSSIKYDWIIKANSKASAATIQIRYDGTDGISLRDGRLIIKTSVGSMAESEPYAYQDINGKKMDVSCKYVMSADGIVSFEFPNGWDHQHDVVIDPTLIFSTYSGSTADNFGYTATYDSKGNAYAAGSVFGIGYPVTLGAFQVNWAGGYVIPFNYNFGIDQYGIDVGITKYNSDGSARLYATYLGGNGDELPHSMVVNSNDELFVFGTTASSTFPVTANAYDTTFNGGSDPGIFFGLGVDYNAGSDIFVSHFTQDGSGLIGSTYVGGTGNDGLNYPEYQDLHYQYADEVRGAIDIDKDDNVYIASCTKSIDFPTTTGAYQTSINGATLDGVVFKMNNSLSTLVWSSYLGGNNKTACYSLALDNTGNVFVCGGTESDVFPTSAGAFQTTTHPGPAEGFIALFNKTGNSLIRSTLYGTPSYDQLFFVQTDRLNNVYVLGQTMDTTSFFTYNAQYNIPKSGQYISKFNYTLDTLIWSTRFGRGSGIPDISPTAFLVDVCRSVYISGWGSNFHLLFNEGPVLTTAGMYVTPDAYQPHTDGNDFYVMVMKDDASAVSYATYFGSSISEDHVDGGTSRFDKKGVIYESVCAGCGGNDSFPTHPANVVSHTNNSPNCNNAIFKLDLDIPSVIADFKIPDIPCDSFNVLFVNSSKIIDTPNTVVTWIFGDGTTSDLLNPPAHHYPTVGVYTVRLIVTDLSSCNGADSTSKTIIIHLNNSTVTLASDTVTCPGVQLQLGIPSTNDTAVHITWTPSAGLSDPTVSDPYITPTQNSAYELTLTKDGCRSIYDQNVYVKLDTISITGSSVLCPNDTIHLVVSDSEGQRLSYTWSPAPLILAGQHTSAALVKPSANTTYYVNAINLSTGCTYDDSITVNVLSSLQHITATAAPDSIVYGDSSQLHVLYTAATSVVWDADPTLTSTAIDSPRAFPKESTLYRVTVSDQSGCQVRDSVMVYVIRTPCASSHIFVPNAFSPNNDGKNDKLFVRGNYIQDMYFTVYDRWGQKVFETRDMGAGWDGSYKGSRLDPTVFGWYAEGTCDSGDKFFRKGNVTLLK